MSSNETTDNCKSPLEPGVGLDRLQRLSRHGKLAGFEKIDTTTCTVAVHGTIYDRVMTVRFEPSEGGSLVTMGTRLKKTMPIVVVMVMLFTLWPGVWFTHDVLTTWFPNWYPRAFWITCAWYLPLTLLAIPALIGQYKASAQAADEHRAEVAQKIAHAVEGKLIETGSQEGS